MIDTARLLADLKRLLPVLEDDMRLRFADVPELDGRFRERYEKARAGKRTAASFETWREGEITQAAAAWLLSCVFLRFLEDNGLIAEPWIRDARDRYQDLLHKGAHRDDREYLELAFQDVAKLPGLHGLFDGAENPLLSIAPTGTAARRLLDFFREPAPDGAFHDFTDTAESTRFLGDLYQDLSEAARKRYALLQTPDFVVDFILDRTLTPALREFGLKDFRLIDPACGSGHFLLAAFDRLFQRWVGEAPAVEVSVLAQRALDSVCGVDLNPYAVSIARFRLLIAAVKACGIKRLSEAYDWRLRITAGDSLMFGPRGYDPRLVDSSLLTENSGEINTLLRQQQYHAVVANPPYTKVYDESLRSVYRRSYQTCAGTFQLGVPFTELFADLAEEAGFIGVITSNAFMKRSFGRKLVEEFLGRWDLTHVVDTSGVCIPWHGTPTAILFSRNRRPMQDRVRMVRGIHGETTEPVNPSQAPVWLAILDQIDRPGSESYWVSSADVERDLLSVHPWPIGGGGASELKDQLDDRSVGTLLDLRARVGGAVRLGADDLFIYREGAARRTGIPREQFRYYLDGKRIAEWGETGSSPIAWCPHQAIPTRESLQWLWPWRLTLAKRATFQGIMADAGLEWYQYMQYTPFPYDGPLALAFAFVETHNQLIFHRGGSIFNRSAPVVKLPPDTDERGYIELLGILNSSIAGFWLRQVCFPKGGDTVGKSGCRIRKVLWDVYLEYDSTNLSQFPLPAGRPTDLAMVIQAVADERTTFLPANLVKTAAPTREQLETASQRAASLLRRMIALQEELDWHVYHLYGLIEESLTVPLDQVPDIELGQRAFEIAMARDPELETTWFERHGSTPTAAIPAHWPEAYRNLVQRRLDRIAADRDIALIEQPEYKRRWNLPKWDELERDALRSWLLDRLESETIWSRSEPELLSIERLADRVRHDADFRSVAALYTAREDYDLTAMVQSLALEEAVPFLPVLRYKESGLRKREQWERTWELQRREDKAEAVGEIPVPPKYKPEDFPPGPAWRLRGKFDVPKERFILYPCLERDNDATPVVAWAGFDHAGKARALAGYYQAMRADDGWAAERLVPVLAGLRDLQPWLRQWHDKPDASGFNISQTIDEFLRGELAEWSITEDDLKQWRPAKKTASRRSSPGTARRTRRPETATV